jgi:hypothetical protein
VAYPSAGNIVRLDNDPAIGSYGCIQYDGTNGRLQYSDNCTTFQNFGTSTIWIDGTGDDIYYTATTPRVGIGNLSPAYTLDVTGTMRISNYLAIDATTGAAVPNFLGLSDLQGVSISSPANNQVLQYNGTNWVNSAAVVTPAGSDTQIQFNDGGALGGDAQFWWDKTNNILTVTGNINYTGVMVDISDRRQKENIKPIAGALEKVAALSGYSYTMKGDAKATPELGLMAQDVQKVFPALVVEGSEGTLRLNSIGMIAPLVEAVKAQQAIIDDQAAKLAAQETALSELKATVEAIRGAAGDTPHAPND